MYYAIIIQGIHSVYKSFSPNNKEGLNENFNYRLSFMIKTISLNAYRPILKQIWYNTSFIIIHYWHSFFY